MTTSTTDTAALNELRLRVALACGWCKDPYHPGYWIEPNARYKPRRDAYCTATPPDYCNSLDAMREAESTLTEPQFHVFACALQRITLKRGLFGWARATAEDRALAFIEAKEYEPLELNAQRDRVSEER